MLDIPTTLFVLAGLVLILVVGAKLGAGSPDSLVGLFVSPTLPTRSRLRGRQESEVPAFVFPARIG